PLRVRPRAGARPRPPRVPRRARLRPDRASAPAPGAHARPGRDRRGRAPLRGAPPLLTLPRPVPPTVGTGPPQRRGGPSPGVTRRRPQPAARSVQRHLLV